MRAETNPETTAATATANAPIYDVVVIGGGPSGATAAERLAKAGRSVLLIDRAGRIKPCGGAIPPRLVRDFAIPDALLVARIQGARIISPSGKQVAMPIEGGYVGMVDREDFDEYLRVRAANAGAERATGTFEAIERDGAGAAVVRYRPKTVDADGRRDPVRVRARYVIGADGARSNVGRQEVKDGDKIPYVIAYHEIIKTPETAEDGAAFDGLRCDVVYRGSISPDFYGWVFPHGAKTSVGMGTGVDGVSLKSATAELRKASGLEHAETVRTEGAPIPLKPLKRWDNGRDVVLAGDAAGVVAPASGEGIYYAMIGGELAADACELALETGDAKALGTARKRFMKEHGRVFWVLGLLQWFWYSSDKRREKFVAMCADPDVQRLTWESYMNKKLVRKDPMAHVRVFMKDMAQLLGLARA
ncbi:MAG: geranylgeranyl diphosphate reductase [Pseudomonadota bacterium]